MSAAAAALAPGRYCAPRRCYCGHCPAYRPPPTAAEAAAACDAFRRYIEIRRELGRMRRRGEL